MRFVLILSIVISTFAFAADKTTIEFELIATTIKKNKEVKVNITTLNNKLKKKGLDGLPHTIVVNSQSKPYWNKLKARIDAAQTVSQTKLYFAIDNGYFYQYPTLCYRGEISGVVDVIDGMQNGFMTNEQGILAIRYGDTEIKRSDEFKSEETLKEYYGEDREDEIAEWNDFDTKSDDVLVMSNLGPQGDGTDLYATTISPCK
jgi:hypothetical protein